MTSSILPGSVLIRRVLLLVGTQETIVPRTLQHRHIRAVPDEREVDDNST